MTPEVSDHWQRAVQALRTAEALVESDPDASASRAYYAAFHGVSAFFALRDQTFTKQEHVLAEDAGTAVERARLILDTVRRTAPHQFPG